MTQLTFTFDELLQALSAYEAEAIELYPDKKQLIQMTVLSMQDFMKSKHMQPFRDDQKQSTLPGLLQVPMSIVNGSLHTEVELDLPAAATLDSSLKKLRYEVTYFSNNKEPKTEVIRANSLAVAEDIANQNCDVLAGEWSTVLCLDKPKRVLPVIQEKIRFKE